MANVPQSSSSHPATWKFGYPIYHAETRDQVRAWLGDVRTGARARAVEANLTRSDAGLSGTVVVALPSGNTP